MKETHENKLEKKVEAKEELKEKDGDNKKE